MNGYCHKCGGVGKFQDYKGIVTCEYCHSVHVVPTDTDREAPAWYSGEPEPIHIGLQPKQAYKRTSQTTR